MEKTSAFLAELTALLGPKGVTSDPDLLAPWLVDWRGRYRGEALAMASPASTAEVAATMKLCAQHAIAIVPQGGNSGMVGGATPDSSGSALLLSLRRMNRIHEIDEEARLATCEAGVILQDLHEAALEKGLRFPLTLGGKGSATVGGLVSTNAGGTQVLRHGSMRALVEGLEAVMPDGSVFSMLTPLKKDNRGFDLKQLLIGSEGTLGIVTAASLRLVPALAERTVAWAGLGSLQEARQLLLHCQDAASDALEGFEVMPQASLEAVLEYLPDARAPLSSAHPWHALIEFAASDKRASKELRERVEAILGEAMEQGLLTDAVLSASEAQAEAFWLLRDSIAPAEKARGVAVQHDISVPVARMPDFVDHLSAELAGAFPDTETVAFGHLGDGNVHFHVIAPGTDANTGWHDTTGKAISARVYDLVTQWGGSISAEHGIGQLKREEHARLADPAALAMLRAVKQALDPQGLLNPGKLV